MLPLGVGNDTPDYLDDPPEIDWPERDDVTEGTDRRRPDRDRGSNDDVELIGMASAGAPVIHNPTTGVLYQGSVNEDGRATPRFEDETTYEIGEDETLTGAIGDLADRLGWNSLTEYGREHWKGERRPDE